MSADWLTSALASLAANPVCGYRPDSAPATEPTAWAALALLQHDRTTESRSALDWLQGLQAADGTLGVTAEQSTPCWPTALATIGWSLAGERAPSLAQRYSAARHRAVEWMLTTSGHTQPKSASMGHDSTLLGWPWVADTHAWLEPTALHVMALRSAGYASHPRTREATTLLLDRLLPEGGCNYGNTVVLGQTLRPHVQPSGLAMMALAGTADGDGRMARTLAYLEGELSRATTASSLSYALLGLAANERTPAQASSLLEAAYERTMRFDRSPLKLALLALASAGAENIVRPNRATS